MTVEPIHWLIAFAILLVIEIMTMGLTTIWFAGGTIAGLVVNLLGGNVWVQLTAFLVVSFLLLLFTRPFAVKYVNRDRVKTNVDEIVGETAVVTEPIDNRQGIGQVRIKGLEWTARSVDDEVPIVAGTVVEVRAVEGVKVIVRERKREG